MYKVKAGKALNLALNNSSSEEALSAFGVALKYATKGGFNLSALHKIEIHESKSTDKSREVELVNKYNGMLKKAKEFSSKIESLSNQLEKTTKSLEEMKSALIIADSKFNSANRVAENMRLQRDEALRDLEETCNILMKTQSEFEKEKAASQCYKNELEELAVSIIKPVKSLKIVSNTSLAKTAFDINSILDEIQEDNENENQQQAQNLSFQSLSGIYESIILIPNLASVKFSLQKPDSRYGKLEWTVNGYIRFTRYWYDNSYTSHFFFVSSSTQDKTNFTSGIHSSDTGPRGGDHGSYTSRYATIEQGLKEFLKKALS
ncbi:TPA: hypothetical protein ACQ7O8_005446 [Klebsiella pneumoniae]